MLALNKNRIAKIFILMILFLFLLGIKSFALVSPTSKFYVNDYANLIDSDVEEYIVETNRTLNSATGAQIVVVTVPNLEGQSLEEYATALFRKFGIGDGTKNNGVLLLLALQEREFRIEVGYGLEGVLTDGKTGRIQDEYIIPYLKEDNWNEGIRNGYSKVLEEVSEEYGVDVGEINAEPQSENNILSIIISAIIMLLFAITPIVKKKVRIIALIIDGISFIVLVILSMIYNLPEGMFPAIASIQAFIAFYIFLTIISRGGGGGGFFYGRWRRWLFRWPVDSLAEEVHQAVEVHQEAFKEVCYT